MNSQHKHIWHLPYFPNPVIITFKTKLLYERIMCIFQRHSNSGKLATKRFSLKTLISEIMKCLLFLFTIAKHTYFFLPEGMDVSLNWIENEIFQFSSNISFYFPQILATKFHVTRSNILPTLNQIHHLHCYSLSCCRQKTFLYIWYNISQNSSQIIIKGPMLNHFCESVIMSIV